MHSDLKLTDAVGVLGLLASYGGMTDMPLPFRMLCFASSAICISTALIARKEWGYGRYVICVILTMFFAYVSFHLAYAPVPKVARAVDIVWTNPEPIASSTSLTEMQLNAEAMLDGEKIDGEYLYDPARGANLPAGTQTLHVKFLPKDPTSYQPAEKNITILINADKLGNVYPVFTFKAGLPTIGSYSNGQSSGLILFQSFQVTNTGTGPGSLVNAGITLSLRGKTYQSLPIMTPAPWFRQKVYRGDTPTGKNDAWNVLPGTSYWVHAVRESPIQVNVPVVFWLEGQFPDVKVQETLKGPAAVNFTASDARKKAYKLTSPLTGKFYKPVPYPQPEVQMPG